LVLTPVSVLVASSHSFNFCFVLPLRLESNLSYFWNLFPILLITYAPPITTAASCNDLSSSPICLIISSPAKPLVILDIAFLPLNKALTPGVIVIIPTGSKNISDIKLVALNNGFCKSSFLCSYSASLIAVSSALPLVCNILGTKNLKWGGTCGSVYGLYPSSSISWYSNISFWILLIAPTTDLSKKPLFKVPKISSVVGSGFASTDGVIFLPNLIGFTVFVSK